MRGGPAEESIRRDLEGVDPERGSSPVSSRGSPRSLRSPRGFRLTSVVQDDVEPDVIVELDVEGVALAVDGELEVGELREVERHVT